MIWIKRRADEHECNKPDLSRAFVTEHSVQAGDIWECDDPTCRKHFTVHYDQRDGLYWAASTSHEVQAAISGRVTYPQER